VTSSVLSPTETWKRRSDSWPATKFGGWPVVENGRLVGIVAQADIALTENEKKTGELVGAISEPSEGERS
jgi:predicted transcriptional regulator